MKEEKKVIDEDSKNLKKADSSKPIKYRLTSFVGVDKYKSIARAIRKGLVTPTGEIAPRRPFNNRKDKSRKGNSLNSLKHFYYEQLTGRY